MKSIKTNKGITLIALIITIVVLLILAAVAISSITNDGILHYAQNAADSWNKAGQNEAGILQNYLSYINPCGVNGHTGEWKAVANDACTKEKICTVCGIKETKIQHTWEGESNTGLPSVCTICELECEHDGPNDEVLSDWHDGANVSDHDCVKDLYCGTCGIMVADSYITEEHDFTNGICTRCEWRCNHKGDAGIESGVLNEDGTVTGVCGRCGLATTISCEHVITEVDTECRIGDGNKHEERSKLECEVCRCTFYGEWMLSPVDEYYSCVACEECGFEGDGKHIVNEDYLDDITCVDLGNGTHQMTFYCDSGMCGNVTMTHSAGTDSYCTLCNP